MDIQETQDRIYTDGSTYQGFFLCGEWSILQTPLETKVYFQITHTITAGCISGKRHGLGMLTNPSGTSFVGHFFNGLPHGLGIMTLSSGIEYHGQFERGRFHGKGMFCHRNGHVFKGQFWEGRVEGYGTVQYIN